MLFIRSQAEGEAKKLPSVKKELENLENKKKVLEFDLEWVRPAIQKEGKEGQEKFEATVVLDTLRKKLQNLRANIPKI